MKVLYVFSAEKINPETINQFFNPVEIDYGNNVCCVKFNEIPDIVPFLKELTKQGNFNARMERDKFDDTYSYHAGDAFILKQHIPDTEWEEYGELNLLKDIFRDKYAVSEKISIA